MSRSHLRRRYWLCCHDDSSSGHRSYSSLSAVFFIILLVCHEHVLIYFHLPLGCHTHRGRGEVWSSVPLTPLHSRSLLAACRVPRKPLGETFTGRHLLFLEPCLVHLGVVHLGPLPFFLQTTPLGLLLRDGGGYGPGYLVVLGPVGNII